MAKQLIKPCAKINVVHVVIDPNKEFQIRDSLKEGSQPVTKYRCLITMVSELLDGDGVKIGLPDVITNKVYNESDEPMEFSKCIEMAADAIKEIETDLLKEYTGA